ncbi:hypothetical protein GCM10017710_34890 [Arthrobacter ramosus]
MVFRAYGAYIGSFGESEIFIRGLAAGPADTVSGMIGRLELLRMLEAASSSMSGIAEVTHACGRSDEDR